MAEENKSSLDPLSALCKRRGFIYHSSEIYGGMPGFWDYGPLGCELKQNVKQAWWQFTVRGRSDVAGLDATIIMCYQADREESLPLARRELRQG